MIILDNHITYKTLSSN